MRLRLVTYNVHKGVGTDGVRDLERIASVARHYDPDVLLLQEAVWYEPRLCLRSQPEEIAALLGMRLGAVSLVVPRRTGIYGNVTLSRLPLAEHATLDLTVPLRKSRAALYTRVQADGRDLHVYNLHLGLARFERRIQAERIVQDAAGLGAGAAVVLAGDVNDWRDRLHTDVFGPAGFTTRGGRVATQATFPSWYPVGHLDRVFVRGDVRLVRVYASRLARARTASDHLPVVADLELSESGGAGSQ